MSLLKKIKKWLTKKPDKKTEEANRVTNYGGGGVKKNNTVKEVKKSIAKAEKANADKQQAKQVTTSSASTKATPPTVKPKETTTKKTTPATATKSDAFKATAPALNRHSTALGTLSTREERDIAARRASAKESKARREYQAARLKPLIDAKYGGDTKESRQRIKMGEYQSDPMVAKYETLKHPVATSAARGALGGTTLGLSDLAAAKLTKGEAREAEKFYQANKNKFAEGVGSFAGAMLPYAGTAKAFENIGARAVGRAAETQIGKRLGAEALTKAIAGNGTKSALARSLVGDAIQDSTLGLFDTMVGVAQRDDLKNASDYLKAVGKGQLANYGLGLAGNVVSNVAPAIRSLRGGADNKLSRVMANDLASRAARNADNSFERVNIRDMARRPKAKSLADNIAESETYDDFVKRNANNADVIAHMEETGKRPKEIWQDARINKGRQNLRRISDDEADRILYDKIPENEVQGWFNDANSGYKPRIIERMAESPDAVNASMNVAYKNYLDSNPKNPLSFEEWLDTPQTLYRGTRGQAKTENDVFSAFTPNREVAEKFAGKDGSVEEISIAPRDTYGSVMHNLESELLVPESAVKSAKTSAKAEPPEAKTKAEAEVPKAEATAEPPKAEATTEPPKKRSKKSKAPKTREEMIADSNGLEQYNARAERQSQLLKEGYEKADNIRAVLAGKEPKTSAKGTKPAAEKLKTKTEANKEPRVVEDLGAVVNKKRKKTTFREQFHEFTSSVKTKLSDSLNAFEEENKQFIRSDRNRWLRNNAAIDKTRRYKSQANRSIGNAQVKWNGDEFENGKSLMQIFDGMDEATENEFNQYLLLKHAPDRIRENKPIFAGTQYDSAEACEKAAKALLEKHPEFADRAEDLYRYTRNELQNRVDAGLLKQDVVDEWNKKYPYYVPTGREGDFSDEADVWDIVGQLKNEGNKVGAGNIKKATGGDQPIRSIKEQLAEATTRNWRDMSMNNLFRNMFGDKVGKELAEYADGGVEKVLDNTINLSESKSGGKYFAEVFTDGDFHRVEIEKRFYDAMKDLYKNGRFGNGLDVMTDAASKVAYPFKGLVTSWNPIFMVKNGFRDFPEAIINSRQTKEFLGSMGDAASQLANGGEFLTAFRNSGVPQANLVNLEEALTKGDNFLKKGANKFATLQEMVETYPRLVEYMATIKKMMPKGYSFKDGMKNVPMEIRDIAAANAADVTVNFGRSGSVGKMLNRGLVPFFNPSIQGWSKFLRNFTEQKSTASLLSFFVKASALGAGLTAINNAWLSDNPNYQQISARDKATNYIIPIAAGEDRTIDNTDLFIKIPKSRFAAVYSLPTVNVENENKMGRAEMIKVTKDQIAPVDPSESHILAPLLDAASSEQGKTWYGTPIVPQALVDLPKSEQYDVNTSWFGKKLGQATSKLPEEFQISPKKADYIIDAETGVIGDFLLPASTPSKQGDGNWVEKHIVHPAGNVLKKAFTIDSVTQNDLSTRFYDQLNKANTNSKSANAGEAEAEEYKRLSSYSTEISGINKAIKELQAGNLKTRLDDVRGLTEVRNQLMQDALDGKDVPSSTKTMDAVQKYVGTTYAVDNLGSTADKEAMKVYGKAKYGDISDAAMKKKMDADKDFYNGVKSIHNIEDKMSEAGIDSNTALTKSIALASENANEELFGAYGCTKQSRTESANKMERAKTYIKNGGSVDEYVKLEKTRKTVGRRSDDEKDKELEELENKLEKGEITEAEYNSKADELGYNPNTSYVGMATSFAQANSPERGYRLYDIKDKNIQKGINLAAMGYSAGDYRKMTREIDSDGNGYLKKQEIIDYVSKSKEKDKATLYDVLYYYKGKYNPFGTPTKYTRAQAADEGKKQGVEWITDERDDIEVEAETTSGIGYGGYYRRGRWHRWGRRGGGSGRGKAMDKSAFAAKQIRTSAEANEGIKHSSSSEKPTYKSLAATLKTTSNNPRANYDTASVKYQTAKAVKSAPKKKTTVKKAPPKVKFKKYEV